jgi:hypothetical protein
VGGGPLKREGGGGINREIIIIISLLMPPSHPLYGRGALIEKLYYRRGEGRGGALIEKL